MSSFSAEWLACREPLDHLSRNPDVLKALLKHFLSDRRVNDQLHILDLGCGSGSNLRALAPSLRLPQCWTLVDHDRELLRHANRQLVEWADEVLSRKTDHLTLRHGGILIEIQFVAKDLKHELTGLLASDWDLVTAAALFDLASQSWIDALVAQLRAPLYATLSFDGQMRWAPSHRLDLAISDAFNAHQRSDKGLGGVALGPSAWYGLQQALIRAGSVVVVGDSPWDVTAEHRKFYDHLMQGVASAVAETARVDKVEIEQWLDYHGNFDECLIGHVDLFATAPPQH